jgi:hypothetical protein
VGIGDDVTVAADDETGCHATGHGLRAFARAAANEILCGEAQAIEFLDRLAGQPPLDVAQVRRAVRCTHCIAKGRATFACRPLMQGQLQEAPRWRKTTTEPTTSPAPGCSTVAWRARATR